MAYGANTTRPFQLLIALICVLVTALALGSGAESAYANCKNSRAQPSEISNGAARKAIFCLLNQERRQHNLPKFDRDKRLQKASQKHSETMDSKGCFSHQCPGEGQLESRLRSVGYLSSGLSRWSYGENIGWGEYELGSPRSMVQAWMRSSGHRANILNRDFRDVGVGFETGATNNRGYKHGGFYTTDFGLRQG